MFVVVEELNDIYVLESEGEETKSRLTGLCEECGMRQSVVEDCLFVCKIVILLVVEFREEERVLLIELVIALDFICSL